MRQGFIAKLIEGRVSLMEVKAIDETGRAAWYFLRVPKAKKDEFEAAMKRGSFNLADYGDIVDSGYGEAAPNEVRDRILREVDSKEHRGKRST